MLGLIGCGQAAGQSGLSNAVTITLIADGDSRELTSQATTVRALLDEAEIELGDLDEVDPPPFAPLTNNLTVTVVRVEESLELIAETIPFERQFVRSESLGENDPPVIVQAGQDGRQETTWRIVYRDGLEAERWPTNTVVVASPVEEIVMIGIGAVGGNVTFPGTIAFLSDGAAVMMRNGSAFTQQLNTGGGLDGRVFSLSPTGSHLLFTRTAGDGSQFQNELFVIRTTANAAPRSLGVENVLWADWNPAAATPLEIAYTTALPTEAPPGWEANNDLWTGDLLSSETAVFSPTQRIDAYPATYGWWGGNYAWSPNGRYIGYSYADEVGVINVDPFSGPARHIQLQQFIEYNTLANWVWVPSLSWSPDSRYLAFINHGSDDNRAMQFDSWVVDINTGVGSRFVDQAGMWGHLHWTSTADGGGPNGRILFLRSSDPTDSQRSGYTLWGMDQDGSNSRQIFPAVGENSRFPRTAQFMDWAPTGDQVVFVFNGQLYLYDLLSGEARQMTRDDAQTSQPSWAPYGAGLNQTSQRPTPVPRPSPPPLSPDQVP